MTHVYVRVGLMHHVTASFSNSSTGESLEYSEFVPHSPRYVKLTTGIWLAFSEAIYVNAHAHTSSIKRNPYVWYGITFGDGIQVPIHLFVDDPHTLLVTS